MKRTVTSEELYSLLKAQGEHRVAERWNEFFDGIELGEYPEQYFLDMANLFFEDWKIDITFKKVKKKKDTLKWRIKRCKQDNISENN